MAIGKELIDKLMATSDGPLIGPDTLSTGLMKALKTEFKKVVIKSAPVRAGDFRAADRGEALKSF